MAEKTTKYVAVAKELKGTCDSDLFKTMVEEGDITAQKLSDVLNAEVKILGYAKCHVTVNDNDFDINYFDTAELGLISSGSELFMSSVEKYFGKVDYVRLTEIKTKKGKTYKAVPVLTKSKIGFTSTKEPEVIGTENDLPF